MMRFFPCLLSIVGLVSTSCGAPQTKTGRSVEPEVVQVPCPEGSARVTRSGQAMFVTVAQAFSGAQQGDRIALCPGRAVHDEPLVLSKVSDVTISGDATSLVASGDFPVVQLTGCTQVVLEGVHVVHEVGEWCAHGCVEISNSKQMTVRNSELDGSGYFGIVMSAVSDSEFRDNLFHNCHFGLSTWGSNGLTLAGNTFRDNRGANLEDSGGSSFSNDVKADNEFGPIKAQ